MALVEESLIKERATPCGQSQQECRIQASSGLSLPGLQGVEKGSDAASLWGPCRDLPSRPPSPARPASCCAEAMGSWRAGELLMGVPLQAGRCPSRAEKRVESEPSCPPVCCLVAQLPPPFPEPLVWIHCGRKGVLFENTGLSCHQMIGLVPVRLGMD